MNRLNNPSTRLQVLILTLILSFLQGCGSTPQAAKPLPVPEKVYKNPEDNPQYWYQRTLGNASTSGKYVTFKTQPVTENWPNELLRWSLRSIRPTPGLTSTTSKTPISDQIVHQLYFHIRYKGDSRDYYRAQLDRVAPKRVKAITKDTGSCQYGCIYSEDFTVALTTDELKQLAETEETRVALTGPDADKPTLLLLPGAYLKGHLQKILEGSFQ